MSKKTKITFFGTHQFAVTILQSLLDSPQVEVVHVITQPDEPVGRKKVLTPPPVKILAEKNNTPVLQPHSLKTLDFRPLTFDLNIVAQYGRIIPKNIIEAPKYGTLNVHTSLLPKYRGASPIQTALVHGETETGVTIMQMDEGMDTGPLLLQKKIQILADETYLKLDKRLAVVGSESLLEAIPRYIDGTLKPILQNEAEATFTTLLSRDDGRIDWEQNTATIYNLYRGLTPWPGVWTTWNKNRLKLIALQPAEEIIPPGQVETKEKRVFIGTKNGSVEVLQLQLEGKTIMDANLFLDGHQNFVHSRVH